VQGFKLSVAEILGRPGHYRDVSVRKPLPGVGNRLAHLSDTPIVADLRAESVVEGILITGPLRGLTELECARCLKSFTCPVDVEVCELFAGPGHEAPPEEDTYEVHGLEIDLEPMLRDALGLALPLNPVCKEDCRGLCVQCGKDLNLGDCSCTFEEIDPRWAGLSALRDKLA
jgi:uncharacterized protein